MFYDLNIKLNRPTVSDHKLEDIFTQLLEYGYRGVAVTIEVDDVIFSSKKEKPKKKVASAENDVIPKPIDFGELKKKFPKLNIYKRINVIIEDTENIRKVLQSKNIKLYDLISFQPENQNVLKSLLHVPGIDIISYNPESRCSLSMTRKWYSQFVNQQVFFEIMYVPAINSQSARRNLIALSHKYHGIGRSKNIIVTSGAEQAHHIRGPYDVMNFNLLFGMCEEEAKKAISRNCEKVLLKSRKQRLGTGMFEITCTENIDEKADVKVESVEPVEISDSTAAEMMED